MNRDRPGTAGPRPAPELSSLRAPFPRVRVDVAFMRVVVIPRVIRMTADVRLVIGSAPGYSAANVNCAALGVI